MKKLIVLSLCATILLAACQPTPEKQVVIQKDMEQMIEKAIAAPEVQPAEEVKQSDAAKEKNPLYDKLGIPERWIAGDEALNGKFVIKADTDIALPEADKLPIVRVQAGRFSQEMVDRFFEVFCGDTVMYEDTGERDKQYYADYILKLQQSLAKIDEADNADKEESSRLREKTQAHIASFYWMGPLEVTDILGEDANLIPFEDVENVFLKMLPVVNGDWVSRAETAVTYTVEKVRLALWRIIEKDSYTKGLLVPVWNIYCASEYTTELGEPYSSSALYYNKPTLCINAIDGSIIDTERGY